MHVQNWCIPAPARVVLQSRPGASRQGACISARACLTHDACPSGGLGTKCQTQRVGVGNKVPDLMPRKTPPSPPEGTPPPPKPVPVS